MKNKSIALLVLILTITISSQVNGNILVSQNVLFVDQPEDTEITVEDSLSLVWKTSNANLLGYELYMEQGDLITMVSSGIIENEEITLLIDDLVIDTYLFAATILSGEGVWSNITVKVTKVSSSGDSSDGFIAGPSFGTSLLAFVTLSIVVVIKRRKIN